MFCFLGLRVSFVAVDESAWRSCVLERVQTIAESFLCLGVHFQQAAGALDFARSFLTKYARLWRDRLHVDSSRVRGMCAYLRLLYVLDDKSSYVCRGAFAGLKKRCHTHLFICVFIHSKRRAGFRRSFSTKCARL